MNRVGKYTYADYLTWDDETRWELIEGVPYDMTPAPSPKHQSVSGELFVLFHEYVKLQKKKCRVFPAPFDVRFANMSNEPDESIETVVQPDISIICDEKKIDDRGCVGPPVLIVEIESPSTAYKDETVKLRLYEKYGVNEYWIVNPDAEWVMIYSLSGKKYGKADYYARGEKAKSTYFDGLVIDLSLVF